MVTTDRTKCGSRVWSGAAADGGSVVTHFISREKTCEGNKEAYCVALISIEPEQTQSKINVLKLQSVELFILKTLQAMKTQEEKIPISGTGSFHSSILTNCSQSHCCHTGRSAVLQSSDSAGDLSCAALLNMRLLTSYQLISTKTTESGHHLPVLLSSPPPKQPRGTGTRWGDGTWWQTSSHWHWSKPRRSCRTVMSSVLTTPSRVSLSRKRDARSSVQPSTLPPSSCIERRDHSPPSSISTEARLQRRDQRRP